MAAKPAFQLGNLDSPKDAPDAIAVLALSANIALPVKAGGNVWLPAPVSPLDFGLGTTISEAVGYAG